MLMHEMMMSHDQAIDLLLETDQLSETEMFLLDLFHSAEDVTPELWTQACQAFRKVLLMQAQPLTPSVH
jgi:hypothetical protein